MTALFAILIPTLLLATHTAPAAPQSKQPQHRAAPIESWPHIATHAAVDVAPQTANAYPLVIFSHGQGVSRSQYTSFIEDLTSHGYVVAAIDHPYGGVTVLHDGRVLSTSADTAGGDSDTANARRVAEWADDATGGRDRSGDGLRMQILGVGASGAIVEPGKLRPIASLLPSTRDYRNFVARSRVRATH